MTARSMPVGRVCFVIDSLAGGGAEQSLAELLPTLRDVGFDVTVICLYRRGNGVHEALLSHGFDVRVLSGSLTRQVRLLRRILRDERPDLVHSTLFRADLVAGLAAWHNGTLTLSSLVNASYDAARLDDPNVSAASLRAARAIDGWRARHLVRHFHAISQAVADSAVRSLRIDPARITVIERGRDTGRLGMPSAERRAVSRRALDVAEDAPVVLSVGRQEYQKGHIHLLRAFDAVHERRPDAVLLLAGREGAATAEIMRQRAQSPAARQIRVLGHRSDVPELLAAADVFAFSSLYEGLGGAVLEAMALALPVVASDVPALREVVEPGSTGFLVPPADPVALADAILGLIEDQGLAHRFGERAQSVFLERFTGERSNRRMVDLYSKILVDARVEE